MDFFVGNSDDISYIEIYFEMLPVKVHSDHKTQEIISLPTSVFPAINLACGCSFSIFSKSSIHAGRNQICPSLSNLSDSLSYPSVI